MHSRYRLSLLVALPLAAFAVCGQQAAGQLSLAADFDHASLASWSLTPSGAELVARDNYYGNGRWRWVYFQASGVESTTPTFTISSNFAGDSTPGLHELEEHEFVYSYDQENWSFFDNNTLGNSDFTFSNSTPFTSDEVYIAYAIPYSYGRSVTHTQAVLASPWATPTASGDAAGVIGNSAAGTDDLGRAVPELDLYGYRITNPATDSPSIDKRKVVISSGLHSGETIGTWTYQGMVDWLVSDDPRATWVRDNVEVLGYPVLNPSGRYAGMSRTLVNNPGVDPNGLWDDSRWSSRNRGCSGDNCQEIRMAGEAMIADVAATPGDVDVFVDFHSTVPDYQIDEVNGIPDDFAYVNSDDLDSPWWLAVRQLQPNLLEEVSGGGSYTTAGFARRELGAEVELTVETQFTWERNTDYYKSLGANFGIALYNAWAPLLAGDFNADGLVNLADYNLWRDTLGQTGPGLAADANFDQQIDTADYAVWKLQIEGTQAALASGAVPEPSSGLPALIVLVAMLTSHQVTRPTGDSDNRV